ncbi:2OG-Fe(II) oxygenase [Aestuariibacter halophilus]|uniref:2OG-Fe(II) oxygenase n=1 Tax=Fluctibacter halophilus TaxID=226011 RepID=A0ABS8G766_9ALTE|nr:2OG-Fe(II) oxygenase [Aestuariibacter halophilus]MCC2616432.1 2OG-Fe(II) oxygenase [Aestuariibacter halophilus]
MADLPRQWRDWIADNLNRGVSAETLLSRLCDNGFVYQQCLPYLEAHLAPELLVDHSADFYQRLATPRLLKQLDQWQARLLDVADAQFVVLEQFLSVRKCTELAALAKTRLRPSEITATQGYEGFRTSSTCDLPTLHHPLAAQVEQRIVDAMGLGIGEAEPIQAQHYAPGQGFKAHTDYFEPGSDEYRDFAAQDGQRSWTFMLYLSEGCQGGETEFPHLGLRFSPRTGMALAWNNLCSDGTPNPRTLHQAHPVTQGEKVVITKWFRER